MNASQVAAQSLSREQKPAWADTQVEPWQTWPQPHVVCAQTQLVRPQNDHGTPASANAGTPNSITANALIRIIRLRHGTPMSWDMRFARARG